MASELPTFDLDPFSDELLDDPYIYYRQFRDAGPVVSLEKYGMVAVSRFDDCRAALRSWRAFSSLRGNAFNDLMNKDVGGSITSLEPPEHDATRSLMTERLKLSEVRNFAPLAEQRAEELASPLIAGGTFDAVREFVEPYVSGIVGDILGLPEPVLELFVKGSSEAFTLMGPMNERAEKGLPVFHQLLDVMQTVTRDDMRPGSLAWELLDEEARGLLPPITRIQLLLAFTGPAFDTTINALGSLLWLLATNPEQWEVLHSDPTLIPAAINEAIRCESPIQIWGRFCHEDASVDGVTIPGGTRVAVLLGSANRDERHYPEPDRFDIRRNPVDHLAFGHGIHLCVGAPLARLEMTSAMGALTRRIEKITLASEPVRRLNNTTRGFDRLPVAVS